MSKFFKILLGMVASIGLLIGLTGCASQSVDMAKVTSVIDVRTAGEYAQGHLQGAVNIDVEANDFSDRVAQLDKAGTYLVYCHSGRRAGIATDNMHAMGFTDVTNIGGINDAASTTKLSIVQ
ncbi:MAG: rhodanese-like domain-containing protein [Micrococcales bacterium]